MILQAVPSLKISAAHDRFRFQFRLRPHIVKVSYLQFCFTIEFVENLFFSFLFLLISSTPFFI